MYTPIATSWFSGGGLMDIGLQQGGVDIIQSLDYDAKAVASMRRNTKYFSHTVKEADITKELIGDHPDADVMVFTYPCTKYSTIADIHGTRTGDELFLHALRAIAVRRPEMFVVENVPGMRKFPIVMEAMSKLKGYYTHVVCPVSADNWLPQKRDRLIIFSTLKPFSPAHPERSSGRPLIKDILETDPEYSLPDYVVSRLQGKYRDMPIMVDPDNHDEIAPTCVAHYSKDRGTRLVKDKNTPHGVRSFTVREYARLQGVPDDYVFLNELNDYKIIGNGVAVDVGRWVGQNIIKYFN